MNSSRLNNHIRYIFIAACVLAASVLSNGARAQSSAADTTFAPIQAAPSSDTTFQSAPGGQQQQQPAPSGQPAKPVDPETQALRDKLLKKRQDRAMLERIFQALNNVDSVYIVHYPTWVIRDEDIRQRVYRAFRNRMKFPSRDSDLTVVTSPRRDEIIKLDFGGVWMGREESRLYLADSLQKVILYPNYLRTELHPDVTRKKNFVQEQAYTQNVSFEASLFGGSLKLNDGWGGEVRVGNDAMGYPFWSSGTATAFLLVDQLKLGIIFPVNAGLSKTDVGGPISLQPRMINGAPGFAVEYEHPIGKGSLNLILQNENLTTKDTSEAVTDINNIYYLRTLAQVFYSANLASLNNEHFFTFSVGVGYHQIGRGVEGANQSVNTVSKYTYESPVIKIDYTRQGMRTYGLSLSEYSSVVEMTAWVEIVKNFVYVDFKYSTPIIRAPEPWETTYFVMISPRIRLAF